MITYQFEISIIDSNTKVEVLQSDLQTLKVCCNPVIPRKSLLLTIKVLHLFPLIKVV